MEKKPVTFFSVTLLVIAGFLVSNPQKVLLVPFLKYMESIFNPAFAFSVVYVFFAYSGWNASAYIAGEVSKPERNFPLSLFIGTLYVYLSYLFINFIFPYTVPRDFG